MENVSAIRIPDTKIYPAYQFYFRIRHSSAPSRQCLYYLIMNIEHWFFERTGRPLDFTVELENMSELMFQVSDDIFESHHLNGSYELDITSMLSIGTWAFHLKEADKTTKDRTAVTGRFFETNIAFKELEDGWIECAIKTDVIDPDTAEEISFAYRPKFVGTLFNDKDLEIKHIAPLGRMSSIMLEDKPAIDKIVFLLRSQESNLPAVIFTYAKEELDIRSILASIDSNIKISQNQSSLLSLFESYGEASPTVPLNRYYLPYDADDFARYSFGYARTYTVRAELVEYLSAKLKIDIQFGDVIWKEPARFGGLTEVHKFTENRKFRYRELLISKLVTKVHEYSKHKNIYFGTIQFEPQLRLLEDRNKLEELRNTIHSEEENRIIDSLDTIVKDLERQVNDLTEKNDSLKKENFSLSTQINLYKTQMTNTDNVVGLNRSGINELYEGEIFDLVVSILTQAKTFYCSEDSRAYDLVQSLLEANKLIGIGKQLFKNLDTLIVDNRGISENHLSKLKKLGFDVQRCENNHHKINFPEYEKYPLIASSTPSDFRSNENALHEYLKRISVYKSK